jgi:hypothetical protein
MARYAEGTTVPVHKSQDEIKTLLRKAGADQIATFESKEGSAVMFTLKGGMYRLEAKLPKMAQNQPAEERRAWRVVLILTKGKLEAIRDEVTTVEREFMASRLLYDGRTADETFTPEFEAAQREGRMPKTLMIGGPSR